MDFRCLYSKKIFSNGMHNAFPSVCRFKNAYYIAFRTAPDHVAYEGKITVLRSEDLDVWSLAAEIGVAQTDLRDPRILEFSGKLFLYCLNRDNTMPEKGTRLFISEDGSAFKEQALSGYEATHLWCFKPHGGILYASGYKVQEKNHYETFLFTSRDGIRWTCKLSLSEGNETAIDFADNGDLYAIIRDDGRGGCPALTILKPLYDSLNSYLRLPVRIQGPMLKRLEKGCLLICRRWDLPGRFNIRTDVLWLEDGKDIQWLRQLPSGGDCSYAAWLQTGENKAAVIYYSSHEHKMDPAFDEPGIEKDSAIAEHSTAADIYLANVTWINRNEIPKLI